jgi:hypothetical protein
MKPADHTGSVVGSGWQLTLGDRGYSIWRGRLRPRCLLEIRQKLRLSQPLAQIQKFEELRMKVGFFPCEQFKPGARESQTLQNEVHSRPLKPLQTKKIKIVCG